MLSQNALFKTRTPQPSLSFAGPATPPAAAINAFDSQLVDEKRDPFIDTLLENLSRELDMPEEALIEKFDFSALLFLSLSPHQIRKVKTATQFLGIHFASLLNAYSAKNPMTANHLKFILGEAQSLQHQPATSFQTRTPQPFRFHQPKTYCAKQTASSQLKTKLDELLESLYQHLNISPSNLISKMNASAFLYLIKNVNRVENIKTAIWQMGISFKAFINLYTPENPLDATHLKFILDRTEALQSPVEKQHTSPSAMRNSS